ncbi:MAG TPA: MMPL family transporter [Solirubrobacteraceae bacterium]|jgi:RND superfamily putative drug exporter|nr:MMPL family transporter [Solirubrobacteraceae bacterium]
MLTRLATFIDAHRRWVLLVTLIGAVLAGAFGFGVAKHMSPYGATDPATQSVQAERRFEAAAGRKIDPGIVAIVRAGDVGSPAVERRVEQVVAQLRAQPDVANAASFYETHDPAMVSRDRRSTYVVVYFKPRSDLQLKSAAQRIEERFAGQRDVRLGGEEIASAQANTQVGQDLARAELLAFPLIFLLSLLFFRSLVASLIPPLIGGVAIVVSFVALRVISDFTDLSVFALNFVTGLGLGLAIDYSLFMISRYREEAAASSFGLPALQRTLQTAGRTILFSSLTVAAAVASLAIFPQRFLYSMGIAGAVVALIAAALALVALPALLAVLGPRINALAPKRLQRAADRDARPAQSGAWYRLARFVTSHPRRVAVLSTALLIALALPFLGIRFISVTASVLPSGASARQVDDALAREYPPNRTSPLQVAVGAPASSREVRALAAQISRLPDVSAIAPSQAAGLHNALLAVAPTQRPLSDATKQLVREVRATRAPVYVGVAGQTAAFLDLEHSLGAHLPIVLALIVAGTLIILFLFTGSVVLPLKAVLMNALSLSAVLGILVLIFQDGHLEGLLSFTSEGALDATQPIFLAAIGFGLATDYGVFLLSRIKEARDSGISDSEAVAVGLERSGRIITAAAVLFAVAIGAFATSQLVFIKELGLGTALAVLIDATIVRALLVPSLMELLGSWNWWAPRPLRRLHDRIGLGDSGPRVPAPRRRQAPEPSRT